MLVSVNVFDPHGQLPSRAAATAADMVRSGLPAGLTVGEITDDLIAHLGECLGDIDVSMIGPERVTVSLVGSVPPGGAPSSIFVVSARGCEARVRVAGWGEDEKTGRRWVAEAAVSAAQRALAGGQDSDAAAQAAMRASFGEFVAAQVEIDERGFTIDLAAA